MYLAKFMLKSATQKRIVNISADQKGSTFTILFLRERNTCKFWTAGLELIKWILKCFLFLRVFYTISC